ADAGADGLVLCDTNGGELPDVVEQRVRHVRSRIDTPLGIHPHNDGALAVANALAAVRAGCDHVQGTINGYGERCGNLDLIPLIANLQLKLGGAVLPPERPASRRPRCSSASNSWSTRGCSSRRRTARSRCCYGALHRTIGRRSSCSASRSSSSGAARAT